MKRLHIVTASLAVLTAASATPAVWAADNALTASSSVFLHVPGDPPGGGGTYSDAPATLDGAAAGSTAASTLNPSRTGDNGNGRVGSSVGSDVTTASYGRLTAANTSTVTTHGNPFLDGEADTGTSSRFDDLLTFYNPNFAPGASFNVRLTMTVAFAGTVDANNFARSYAIAQGGLQLGLGGVLAREAASGNAAGDPGSSWHDPLVQTYDFSVTNGFTVPFYGALSTATEASLYNGLCDNCTTSVSAGIQSATANFSLSGVDPGLELSSASGYLYGVSPVPEPAPAVLWGAGLLALAAAGARRQTGRATCP